ncbi:MAG: Unknown protein [uncultured Sulfurovum sp.]|uniref:Peptidase S8/S53 domain-containing protein n=1 Tax=uncultured Sulfurovum sp. TaxID=269237 RepID=A0A6S6SZV3_9BACT|nr:MAG: Unknown protein [uncultured Sulfurovum sp.]
MWTGTWQTTYGEIILRQVGNKVSGEYIRGRGIFDGELDLTGKVLKGKFTNTVRSKEGNFIFNLESNNTFEGKWGWDSSIDIKWNGTLHIETNMNGESFRTLEEDTFGNPNELLRFVLHSTKNIEDNDFLKSIDIALGGIALKYIPNLLKISDKFWESYKNQKNKIYSFDYKTKKIIKEIDTSYLLSDIEIREKTKLSENKLPPRIPILINKVMPNLEKDFPNLPLELKKHKFFILTLPYYLDDFKNETCNLNGTLFDISYLLKHDIKLDSVSPDLEYEYIKPLSSFSENKDCSNVSGDWHLKNIRFDTVPNNIDGSGVRIGHPDTGWTPHPELNFKNNYSENYDLSSDVNIFDVNSESAEEAVPSGNNPLFQYHHGTSTGGLLISKHEYEDNNGDKKDSKVKGIATGATVVSIRAINSVIRVGTITLTSAISKAIEEDVDIISLSVGGIPFFSLEWLIKIAVWKNIIVVAAAGNYSQMIVAPASYSDCIAVGGSTMDDLPWVGSAYNIPLIFNSKLDISAPSKNICVPSWKGRGAIVRSGNGTSYATAIVAGAAALWLQTFNRNTLINQLSGGNSLQELFRAHLHKTAREPSGWNTLINGPGILDLSNLLKLKSLPNPSIYPFPPVIDKLDDFFGMNLEGSVGNRFFPPAWLPVVFGDRIDSVLDEGGEELVSILLSNPELVSIINSLGEDIEEVEEIIDTVVDTGGEVLNDAIDIVENSTRVVVNTIVRGLSNGVKAITGWFL